MAAKRKPKLPPVQEATPQEWHELIDGAARYHLQMSGDDFIRKWNAGEFRDPDGTPVIEIAMLLPVASRTAAAVVRDFLAPLQRAVSCVTDAVLLVGDGGYQPARAPHSLTYRQGTPIALGGDGRIAMRTALRYVISSIDQERFWLVDTVGYAHTFYDAVDREIVAYHWHPNVPGVDFPHLHIGHGAVRQEVLTLAGLSTANNALREDLAQAHLPTGRIALQEVLRLAIDHFGVEPRRDDWREILR